MIKLTECPRDAMQGIKDWIPTGQKTAYLNALLEVGFDVLDFGSFVSPKAIPQLKDTAEVLSGLNLDATGTDLLAIVANERGASDASSFEEIKFLGFPFSISEKFQKRNTNKSIDQSLYAVERIKTIADKSNKEVMIYISMAFGNPYGENWHPDIAISWSNRLNNELGISHIALSDTIGVSNSENITQLFTSVLSEIENVNFGAHLHTKPETWKEKIEAAYKAGCLRFDGALKGYGGCPMADDSLTGNMPSELIAGYFRETTESLSIDEDKLVKATSMAHELFSTYN
ncbi:MAG: hydroxymethylglutaryl-CoA lyase [Flavobacteriales bacterium]